MRSDPGDYELVAPQDLQAVVALLAKEPGAWLPIAGGTDLMVLYGAGTLRTRKLVSIWNLSELRRIEESADEIVIGAGCTYTDLQEHPAVMRNFSLLTRAASWTGGIANQNRGTIGGNIANASPAADCLPALLVYDADLTLTSIRGDRKINYRSFHTGYKTTALAIDELIRSIHMKKHFAQYFAYSRKVGARQSQAIAKVNVAALGGVLNGIVEEVRIALGSVAPVPLRLDKIERELVGKDQGWLADKIKHVRQLVAAEISPISDIRSNAKYRTAVAGNLVVEFVEQLFHREHLATDSLARWNALGIEAAVEGILPCCGAKAWAYGMATRRPFESVTTLLEHSRDLWWKLDPADWLEAFSSHPRIGESATMPTHGAKSGEWSSQEQRQVDEGDANTKFALAEGNRQYEERFGRIFIVCATGKAPNKILEILQRRLLNDEATELRESAEEQEQIMQIRLKKWLAE